MNELDAPPAPSAQDLRDMRTAANAALTAATVRRHEIEGAIRATTSVKDLAGLHDQWAEVVEQQAAADDRCRELELMLLEIG